MWSSSAFYFRDTGRKSNTKRSEQSFFFFRLLFLFSLNHSPSKVTSNSQRVCHILQKALMIRKSVLMYASIRMTTMDEYSSNLIFITSRILKICSVMLQVSNFWIKLTQFSKNCLHLAACELNLYFIFVSIQDECFWEPEERSPKKRKTSWSYFRKWRHNNK